jgi:hypothetical protein
VKVLRGTILSDAFPIQNCLKQGDGLSPLLLNFVLEYAIRYIQENQEELELSRTHKFLIYANDGNILVENS